MLIPVLDGEKHYWAGEDEVEKLPKRGGDWLSHHPLKDLIARRYLKHRHSLTRMALARLVAEEERDEDEDEVTPAAAQREVELESRISLSQQRLNAVRSAIIEHGAATVLDLGCGENRLIETLLAERPVKKVTGMDLPLRNLDRAAQRLKLNQMPPARRERVQLLHGSLVYRDERLREFDAAWVIEVIKHLDPPRLAAFERVLFESIAAGFTIVTTPNIEYDVKFEGLPPRRLRHDDHRFEWTREQSRTGRRTRHNGTGCA